MQLHSRLAVRFVLVTVVSVVTGSSPARAAGPETLELLTRKLAASGQTETTLTVTGVDPPLPASCSPERAIPTRPVTASGRVGLRLVGKGCPGWVWATVEVRSRRADDDRASPALPPGTAVRVVVRVGVLAVEAAGRTVSCARPATCAVLQSGRHVEGRLVDGKLIVEVP